MEIETRLENLERMFTTIIEEFKKMNAEIAKLADLQLSLTEEISRSNSLSNTTICQLKAAFLKLDLDGKTDNMADYISNITKGKSVKANGVVNAEAKDNNLPAIESRYEQEDKIIEKQEEQPQPEQTEEPTDPVKEFFIGKIISNEKIFSNQSRNVNYSTRELISITNKDYIKPTDNITVDFCSKLYENIKSAAEKGDQRCKKAIDLIHKRYTELSGQ